jgi:ketosteroid isomerase-like protein
MSGVSKWRKALAKGGEVGVAAQQPGSKAELPTDELELLRSLVDIQNSGDLEAGMELFHPALVWINRDGRHQGAEAHAGLREFFGSQLRQFEIRVDVQELYRAHDAGWILFWRISRVGRDPALGQMNAWPAQVVRIQDGQIVFYEGYMNRVKALTDNALSPDAVPLPVSLLGF